MSGGPHVTAQRQLKNVDLGQKYLPQNSFLQSNPIFGFRFGLKYILTPAEDGNDQCGGSALHRSWILPVLHTLQTPSDALVLCDASISATTSHRRICSLTDSRTPVATNRQHKSPFPLTAWQTEVKASVGKRWMVMEKQWGWRVQRLVGKPACDLHHHGNPEDGYTDFILFFFFAFRLVPISLLLLL